MKMPKARQNNRSPNRTVRFVLQSGNFFVGLSMICYTKAQKNIESSLRRDPVKRAHGKVIVFTKMDGKLSFEVVEGVKRMSCVKVLIILAV